MAEYEELRLTVTLIDNASAGLVQLRQHLRGLGGGADALMKQVDAITQKLKPLEEQSKRTATAMETLARGVRIFTAQMIAGMASETLRTGINILTSFTDQMVRLGAVSTSLGVGAGQIKGIV